MYNGSTSAILQIQKIVISVISQVMLLSRPGLLARIADRCLLLVRYLLYEIGDRNDKTMECVGSIRL